MGDGGAGSGYGDGDDGDDGDDDGDGVARRMRLRVVDHPVGDAGRRLSRVLTPARPLRSTYVYPTVIHWGSVYSSRADILRLGALVRLAATSPHSVVHVPAPPDAVARTNHLGQVPVALVVARDDVGLRPSDWPRLRARAHHGPVPGTVRTMATPAPRPPATWTGERMRFDTTHPEQLVEHAGTLFVIAHPRALFGLGDALTDCGERVATDSDVHRYGEALLTDLFPDLGLIAVEPISTSAAGSTPQSPDPRLRPGARPSTRPIGNPDGTIDDHGHPSAPSVPGGDRDRRHLGGRRTSWGTRSPRSATSCAAWSGSSGCRCCGGPAPARCRPRPGCGCCRTRASCWIWTARCGAASRGRRPLLRLGTLQSLADSWLPEVLTAFAHGAGGPGTAADVALTVASRDRLAADLADGLLDATITLDSGPPATGPVAVLGHDRVVLVASPSHPLAGVSPLTLEAVREHDFLVTEAGCIHRQCFDEFGRDIGPTLRIGMITGSLNALRRLAVNGRGLVLLPRFSVEAELESGDLVMLDLRQGLAPLAVEARWRAGIGAAEAPLAALVRLAQRYRPGARDLAA